jgi:hypothetical protein
MSEINSLVRWQASHARPQMADPVFGVLSAWLISLQLPPGLSPVLSPHWNAGRRVSAQLQLQRNTSSKLDAKNVPIGTLQFSSCEGDYPSLACYRCADLHKFGPSLDCRNQAEERLEQILSRQALHNFKRSNRRLDPELHLPQSTLGADQHLPSYDNRVRVIQQRLHGAARTRF